MYRSIVGTYGTTQSLEQGPAPFLPAQPFFPYCCIPDLDGVSEPVHPSLSAEPMVVFAKEQPARSEVQAKAGARTTLSCEVAQAQMEVTWYKDGKKLSSSSKVHVEAKGCTRQLVVQQAGKADAGEYSCEAGGQKVSFHLDVTGGCQGWVGGCECGGCWVLCWVLHGCSQLQGSVSPQGP